MVQDELKPNELLFNLSSVWCDFARDAAIFELFLSVMQNPPISLFASTLPEHFRALTWKPFEKKCEKSPLLARCGFSKARLRHVFQTSPRKELSNAN